MSSRPQFRRAWRAVAFLLAAAAALALAAFRPADAPRDWEFPRDHGAHDDFQTEWWYYTGNLRDPQGRRFGFELTFFRRGVDRPNMKSSSWQVDDLYLAHLALTDFGTKSFYHRQRINRAGPGIAGANGDRQRIWNGNWHVQWRGEGQELQAVADEFTLHLELKPKKAPVIHGRRGVSQKGPGVGRASHYVSFTRLDAGGRLELKGSKHELTGTAWMDHEFFTNQLTEDQVGWDWFSIQLENGAELMLGRLRRKDGTQDPYSHGSYVEPSGATRHLDAGDFQLTPGSTWTSSETKAVYPVQWSISVPSLNLSLNATTPMPQQELTGRNKLSPTYWEGAMDYEGLLAGKPIRGQGYLEMTGYAERVNFGEPARP